MDIQKRRGFVTIAHELFDSLTGKELKEIFSNIFPVSTTPSVDAARATDYYCLSAHFDEVAEGEYPPKYEIIFERDEIGVGRFKQVIKV